MTTSQAVAASDAARVKVTDRALAKRAPFHLAKNSVGDALLIEIFAEAMATATDPETEFFFVTDNTRDFSQHNGDRRLPHADLEPLFQTKHSNYATSIVEVIKAINSDMLAEYEWEHAHVEAPRQLSEILDAEHRLFQQVWYNRHWNWRTEVESGAVQLISQEESNKLTGYHPEVVVDTVWAGAVRRRRRRKRRSARRTSVRGTTSSGDDQRKLSALRGCSAMSGTCLTHREPPWPSGRPTPRDEADGAAAPVAAGRVRQPSARLTHDAVVIVGLRARPPGSPWIRPGCWSCHSQRVDLEHRGKPGVWSRRPPTWCGALLSRWTRTMIVFDVDSMRTSAPEWARARELLVEHNEKAISNGWGRVKLLGSPDRRLSATENCAVRYALLVIDHAVGISRLVQGQVCAPALALVRVLIESLYKMLGLAVTPLLGTDVEDIISSQPRVNKQLFRDMDRRGIPGMADLWSYLAPWVNNFTHGGLSHITHELPATVWVRTMKPDGCLRPCNWPSLLWMPLKLCSYPYWHLRRMPLPPCAGLLDVHWVIFVAFTMVSLQLSCLDLSKVLQVGRQHRSLLFHMP